MPMPMGSFWPSKPAIAASMISFANFDVSCPAWPAASCMRSDWPGLVTASLAGYEALALRLARDPILLPPAPRPNAENRSTHPLFHSPRFTRDLEKAYPAMLNSRPETLGKIERAEP